MKNYIVTKLVQADPAYRVDGRVYPISGECPRCMNREEGYKVRYPDGYESWSPKDVFEKTYLEITTNHEFHTGAPRICQRMVDEFIRDINVWTEGNYTEMNVVLRNGFEIETSARVMTDKKYAGNLGAETCLENTKKKVWLLLEFLLQTAENGIN